MDLLKKFAGPLSYALLFVFILPLGLYYWAKETEHLILFEPIQSFGASWIFATTGLIVLLWGMLALKIKGGGLPMNAFPPVHFVSSGPYRFVHHPIYIGFGFILIGVSILLGSASGLWLVTPVTILGMSALVLGYENIDLKLRFPGIKQRVVFELSENSATPPDTTERWIAFLKLFVLLILVYFILDHSSATNSINTNHSSDNPPDTSSSLLQPLFVLLLLLLPALLFKTKSQLRDWSISVFIGLAIYAYLGILYPSTVTPWEKYSAFYFGNKNVLSFFNWTVPLFLPLVLISKSLKLNNWKIRLPLQFIGLFSLLIQFSNSIPSLKSILLTLVLFLVSDQYQAVWGFLRNTSEIIANSWKEWTFGKIRVINHGIYVGICAFTGVFIAGILTGQKYAWALMIFCFLGVSFAAIWAQLIEGSDKLKRPFGYYGCLFSIPPAALIFHYMGIDSWTIVAAVSVVMPWSQAIGRLRCLVNGCCHGRPVESEHIGIRYSHPRSRVCYISGLKEKYLHPTPLYSILWLVPVGFVLLSLWDAGFMPSFIFGIYLILTGLGRFVEEAYRGEVQTRIIKGLHLYQWTAIVTVLCGIAMTMVPSVRSDVEPGWSWQIAVAALSGGLFTFAAMGVDFPNSNKRFSRLV